MPAKNRTTEEQKEKQRTWSKTHYNNNKESYLARNAKKKAEIKSYIVQYKEYRGCMDCGGKYPSYVLDLDHRDPSKKSFTPSHLYRTNSWNKMMIELEKCDVVCANCHRIRTHDRGYWKHDRSK